MSAGPWLFTNSGRTSLLTTVDWNSGSFKMALFTSASNLGPSSTTYAGLTNEHANGNGYATGGTSVTVSLSGSNPVKADSTDATWNATGAGITAKWAAIYEVGGVVLVYCLVDSGGADVSVTAGNPFIVEINPSGIFNFG